MLNDKSKAQDLVGASVESSSGASDGARGGGVFHFQCFDKDGNLKWEDKAHNLVVNEGLKDMNDKYFTGATYTAAWYLGLITGPGASTTIAAGDTLASHTGWTEDTSYSGNRKAVTFAAASLADPSVITNQASPSQFSITGTTTIAGAFFPRCLNVRRREQDA